MPRLKTSGRGQTASNSDADPDADVGADAGTDTGCRPSLTGFEPATYRAKLYAPLFYSSKEGLTIETQPTIAATALTHALGYELPSVELEKRYIERGMETTTPTYDHLRDLDLFCSDMTPIEATVDERTFRTASYGTENRVVTGSPNVAKQIGVDNSNGSPKIKGKSASISGWKEVQRYTGISPGAEYEFTVWTSETTLPDTFRFRMGISRSGEFVAKKQPHPAETVTLNAYLLSEVYDLGDTTPADILEHAESYEKGNDPRLVHYVGVDRDWVDANLLH